MTKIFSEIRVVKERFALVKSALAAFLVSTLWSVQAADSSRHVTFSDPEAEVSDWAWLPVTLNEGERKILERRSDSPETALDFYLLLPDVYFDRVEDSLERRITFIEQESLTDHFLRASFTIPQVDAGAFFVTIRLFESEDGPLIAIRHRGDYQIIYRNTGLKPGRLMYIRLGYPQLWRFREASWIREDDGVLPRISADAIIHRYRNHYEGHLNYPTQRKWISLGYALAPEGPVIRVTGRENFMPSGETYVWTEYRFDGKRFVPSADIEQATSSGFGRSAEENVE